MQTYKEEIEEMEYFKNNKQFLEYLYSVVSAASDLRAMKLQKDDYVITEYEKAQHVFLVTSGFLSVEVTNDVRSYISAFVFENDFFGLDAFSSYPSKSHAIRVTSSEAVIHRIEKQFMLDALKQRPDLYELLLTNFTDIFQRHYLFNDFLSLSPIERVKKVLRYLSDYIGEIDEYEQLKIPGEITQEVLARFCRTSQSRISVCLKELYEMKFLTNKKAPFVLNQE
jgi:CRP-like cAMP-binding protein